MVTLSKHRKLIAKLEALGQRGDALRALDYMREFVARDSAKLGVLEQLLACTHVGIPLKAGYVADMEEKKSMVLQRSMWVMIAAGFSVLQLLLPESDGAGTDSWFPGYSRSIICFRSVVS
ncbi:hypothetical protein Tco_1361504 [Tanacetum coccineum]